MAKDMAINFDGASVDESEFKPSQLKEDVQSSTQKSLFMSHSMWEYLVLFCHFLFKPF